MGTSNTEEKPFRPMLACDTPTEAQIAKIRWPLMGSVKLDGIRAVNRPEGLMSRSMKLLPSAFAQRMFGRPELKGFDGELIAGFANDVNVFSNSMSAVMTHGGMIPLTYFVFDLCDDESLKLDYETRLRKLTERVQQLPQEIQQYTVVLPQQLLHSWAEVERLELAVLADGYEGLIVRSPSAPYKQNRSTLREQYLIKVLRYATDEAVVIGFEELQHNHNEARTDERGYTVRSTEKAGKVGGNTLGALIVKDLKTGVVFNLGSGFDAHLRDQIWNNKEMYMGAIAVYRHFLGGAVDKPRKVTFKGFRDPIDMD